MNAHGELVGINTFIISNSGSFAGAGFAIPSQIVRATAEQLIKTGAVHHGYLGISLNDVTPENANFFNLKKATGAIVAQVTPDSPASRAGLKNGDVIDDAEWTEDRERQCVAGCCQRRSLRERRSNLAFIRNGARRRST